MRQLYWFQFYFVNLLFCETDLALQIFLYAQFLFMEYFHLVMAHIFFIQVPSSVSSWCFSVKDLSDHFPDAILLGAVSSSGYPFLFSL